MIKNERVVELLREYKRKLSKERRELRSLPEGYLYKQKRKGAESYVHVTYSGGKRTRRGITTNRELICALARKAYLKESVALLTRTISALETVANTCPPPTPETILGRLPSTYKSLPREGFFPKNRNNWKNASYEKSTYRPEEKTHTASNGERVRSKSEALIVDLLEKHKIPYRYEQMLYIQNQEFAPDFTILVKNQTFYWEHCGKVNDPGYVRNHNWKISVYGKAGIVPWKNLVITYDDEEGNFNSKVVEGEIINKLLD
ncbi:MAG: hypothetical protein ACOYJU_07125 [Anaerovoracaceae bacterium]